MQYLESENICGTKDYTFCKGGCDFKSYGWDLSEFSNTHPIFSFYNIETERDDIQKILICTDIVRGLGYSDLYDLAEMSKNLMDLYAANKQKLFKSLPPVPVEIIKMNLPHVAVNHFGISISFEVSPVGFKGEDLMFMVIYEHTYNNGLKLVAQHNHY